ncbi:MAG: hypothetical protein ACYDFU_00325, partial [Nitrospirota bacterium]
MSVKKRLAADVRLRIIIFRRKYLRAVVTRQPFHFTFTIIFLREHSLPHIIPDEAEEVFPEEIYL